MKLSIMQGRLCPPEEACFQAFPCAGWRNEFERAATAGLQGIEWIYDVHGEGENPIETDDGIAEIKALSQLHGIRVASLCADWFMENLLFGVSNRELEKNLARLRWLVKRCHQANILSIVLPFVDSSSMYEESAQDEVIKVLKMVAAETQSHGVELHLETDLDPHELSEFLGRLAQPLIKVNYDTGNSAALGYCIKAEWAAYGMHIGSVHLKDRVLGGGTVPLGEGDVHWPDVFSVLDSYHGPLVLQVARGTAGEEIAWAKHNREWVENAAVLKS